MPRSPGCSARRNALALRMGRESVPKNVDTGFQVLPLQDRECTLT